MRSVPFCPIRAAAYGLMLYAAAAGLIFAQNTPDAAPQEQNAAPHHGWRRIGDLPPQAADGATDPAGPNYAQSPPQDANQPPVVSAPADPPQYGIPPQLTIKAGTFVTVRVNQVLSSDRNEPGDAFSATLVRPIVVDGIVVAQRGQTVGGRVAEAKKAGRVEGVSRLGIQLTDLSLVDGQQVPIQSQLISRSGPTSEGRDAAGVAATTATGAVIGAAADWGRGAAIGAGAGAAAGVLGVLLTRGRPTVIYPESVLTFRLEAPVTISTERAPQAFRYVDPNTDYQRPSYEARAQTPPPPACGPYACPPPPPPYYGPYYYPYPYYYAPGFAVFYGPRFYYGHRLAYRAYRR